MTTRLYRRPCRRLSLMIDGSGPGSRLAAEIVRLARASGLPSVGVFHGMGGFAPGARGCGSRRPASQPPILIIVTGDPESIDDFATGIAPVLEPGGLTVEDLVEIVSPVATAPAVRLVDAAAKRLAARAQDCRPGSNPTEGPAPAASTDRC